VVVTRDTSGGGTPETQVTVTSPGQLITGAILSTNTINWSHIAAFPHESIIEYVLVTVRGHGFISSTVCTLKDGITRPQLSLAIPPFEKN
jgi:hypothetical protein